MNEERKMILDMLSERKITADEAAELLRALGGAGAGEASAADAAGGAHGTQSHRGAASDRGAPGATHETGTRSGPAPGKSILEDFLGKLDIDLSNLPFALSGEGYRFDEEYSGEFAPGRKVKLDLNARNGRVEVFGWDEPGWRVILHKKIRAQSEESARERAAEVCRFTHGTDFLQFEEFPSGWGASGVSVEVYVPRDREYEAFAVSSNGRVVVERLTAGKLVAKTANGKVGVRGVVAQEASLTTANGGITFAGTARRLECGTANGTVTCCPVARQDMDCRLHTSNGSIRVKLPRNGDVGYDVDAYTSHGTIDVDVVDFVISAQEKQFGRRTMQGRTAGYAGKGIKTRIDARTTNGSIRVVPAQEGEDC